MISIRTLSLMSLTLVFLILICPSYGLNAAAIIANHNSVAQFPQIPLSTIEQLQDNYRFYYGHTSHGSQIVTGLSMLAAENSIYQSPYFSEASSDLGTLGDTLWVPLTRSYLNTHPDIDVVLWSWCGGVSTNTTAGINIYLDAMNRLEDAYPNVIFVYMTGHLDGQGPAGNLYAMNSLIRSYCVNNDKILFDFADIESYNPDGTYYPNGSDACEWCLTWCASHNCPGCSSCAHSHCFNCYQKGKAFWWMMARAIGWTPGSGEIGDTISPALIADLMPVTGTADGTIDLTWTATGNDGAIGTADSYVIKYSLDSITEATWPLATVYSSSLDPQASGSVEHLTLGGLIPAEVYFVAIKTTDDASNQSALSNVASAEAYLGIPVDISVPVVVGYTTARHALMGIPRYRGGRQGDTLIMVTAQFGSNQTGWVVSYDRGTTWKDVRARWMTMNNGTQTWYSSDHSAAWFAGGLHIASRGYAETDPAGYRYVAAPYSGEANMEAVDFPAAGTNTYYPVVVANGANDVWLFDMSEGSSRNNLRYWHSTDRFATPVTPGRVCTITDDPQNSWRMGVIMGANGYPKVSIYKYNGGFCIWTYNPATQTFDSSLVVANAIGGLGRSYAQAEMNGLDHVVYTSGWRGSLVHFYETSDGHFDSVIVSAAGEDSYSPQLCVYGEGAAARLYVAYADRNSAVCVKGWTLATGWDADSVVVSGIGHSAPDPALVPQVPSSWGFLPIWYHNVVDNNLYFVKMELTPGAVTKSDNWVEVSNVVSRNTISDTTPPVRTIDLGAATGTESGTIDLTWTATSDGGVEGTADSYVVKYSLDSITEANWPQATIYPSPLHPKESGSDERLTLRGLIPAQVYFVAVKVVGNAVTQSELSNVASAGAYLDVSALESGLPREYGLAQNYPNPFNPSTTIEYELPADSRVLITVLNILGQNVSTVVDRMQPAGRYRVIWDARNDGGMPLATGVYFCCLQTDGFFKTTKMVLVR